MHSFRSFVETVAVSSIVLLGFASLALADPTPYDPHVLYATGGDATDITGPSAIIFSSAGGGIFVFHNATGADLSALDVDVAVPDALALTGFSVTGDIVIPPGSGTQRSSFSAGFVPNSNCAGTSSTTFCEEMIFALIPGPLVPKDGNFVLDFDDPIDGQYQGLDAEVANGSYTQGTMTTAAQAGSWGAFTMGTVTPVEATPEPRYYAGLLAGIVALGIFAKSWRS